MTGPSAPIDTLLLWGNALERQAVYRILAATGATVHQATTVDTAPKRPYRLAVLDSASVQDKLADLLARLEQLDPKPTVLIATEGNDKNELVELFANDSLTNVLAKNSALQAQDLFVTVQKLLRNDIFGAEKYLAWGTQAITVKVRSSRDKDPVLEEMETYLNGIGCHRRIVGLARGVGDELLMNAIFNAPVDQAGVPKYARTQRSELVTLTPEEEVTLSYACDGRTLAVAVSDPFGRLERDTVRSYLRKCINMGPDQVDDKPGGAGLGLYYVFNSLNSLIINIAQRRRCEMIGLLDVSGSFKSFATKPKSLHLFFAEDRS